jgi:hypothetical protein
MKRASLGVCLWLFVVTAASTASTQGVTPKVSVGNFGPEIQFDSRGVDFGPWIQQFVPQIRSHWVMPCVTSTASGHTVITLNIQKDGTITDVNVRTASRVRIFNGNAQRAIVASSPTVPLPSEYPASAAFFTVTFYYNEVPPGSPPSTDIAPNWWPAPNRSCTLVGADASEVQQRLGKPTRVDGLTWTYTTSRGILAVYFDDAHLVISVRPTGLDLAIFKK